jgi:tRNA (guanine-N7-)-methyltransferase
MTFISGCKVRTTRIFTTIFVTVFRSTRAYSTLHLVSSRSSKLTRLHLHLLSSKEPHFRGSSLIRMMGTDSIDPNSSKSIIASTSEDDFYKALDDEDDIPSSSSDIHSPWSKNFVLTKTRFRQHVNPLARQYQIPTTLSDTWPSDGTFTNPSLPLHIDIGCAKGGFLLKLALERTAISDSSANTWEKRNYLGLEIRPSVALFAKQRISKWGLTGKLDFMGCNANVDLDRILTKYTASGGKLALVSIQYPDPHFKKHHQKRRVVTPQLMATLVKFLPPGGEIFIQSDVKEVLDHMRLVIREEGGPYFQDILDLEEYMPENPIGVMTEREISVLKKNLPVYRTLFRRTDVVSE